MSAKSKGLLNKGSSSEGEFTIMAERFTKVIPAITNDNNDRQLIDMAKVKIHSILKKLMASADISARQLSKETGIPSSTLSTYLSGKKASYSPEHLVKLASFFEVSLDYLLKGETDTLKVLNSLTTDEVFSGWLKVRIERAIPNKKGNSND